jgi:hypothetical protein
LPDGATAKIQILDASAAKLTLDSKAILPKKRMKWITDYNFTLVMGIIVPWL